VTEFPPGSGFPPPAGQPEGSARWAEQTAPATDEPFTGAYQPAGSSTPQVQQARGFFSALFDFGFSTFVTPKVIKAIYGLSMILIGLMSLLFIFAAFHLSAFAGIIALLVLAPLYFVISVAMTRVGLEFFMVIFRMGEDIKTLRDRGIPR
jgi:uncharacterized protein DUF4282